MANIVSLQDVRTHLRWPSPSLTNPNDAALQKFINAADECIEFECDDILPHRHDETYDGGNSEIWLYSRPILSVQNVEESWGYVNYELDYVQANSVPASSMFAYSIDNAENGVIVRRSAGNVVIPFRPGRSNIRIQYTTGYAKLPSTVILAELELIAHWWNNSQLRAAAVAGANLAYDTVTGTAYTRDTESGSQNLNIGVPYRILEQIKAHRHMPIIA